MYCPFCGKELLELKSKKIDICPDGTCRGVIVKSKVGKLSLELYSEFTDEILEVKNKNKLSNKITDKYYMLIKKDSYEPLLLPNTTSPLEKNKQTLCILKCKSQEEAYRSMKDKFKVMNITPDMVVEIHIGSKINE